MKVIIDSDQCTACRLCCDNVPCIFKMEKDVAQVIMDKNVPIQFVNAVMEAIENCPAECIHQTWE